MCLLWKISSFLLIFAFHISDGTLNSPYVFVIMCTHRRHSPGTLFDVLQYV